MAQEAAAVGSYPAAWEADAVLADGATAHVRPIRPDDGPALEALHARLSKETVYLRFFSPLPRLSPAMVERFTHVDYDRRMALVAELGDDLVAVARYDAHPDADEAEVAFVVADEHQGRGVSTLLLEMLAAYARERGIVRFTAETLPGNARMLNVFHSAGFADVRRFADGVVQVAFPIEPTATSEAAAAEREHTATVRSVRRLLAPRSVAVVGASRRPGTIGHEVLRRLLAAGFAGPVYPVHPTAPWVASVRAYPSVLDVPDEVDLAVVVVPAAAVLSVVDDCARKRVDGLVVVSSGFAETGPEGAALERQVVERARRNGMRLVGPNCLGVVNTDPGVRLHATFAAVDAPPGRIAISSQSGALGGAVLAAAAERGLGVSSFVAVGNKADVSGNDLLSYWEEDPATDVVALYLESFGNPRRFARVARRVARKKPVVAVKGGRTPAGSRAARRTAAESAPDLAVDALFRQAGVTRVDTMEQLFDVVQALSTQPLPQGRRVAIVGNAGGPGVLAADACEGVGLVVPELAEATRAALATFLPASGVGNPLELAPTATAADYERALALVLADGGVDAAVATFIPPLGTGDDDVAAAVGRAAATSAKPVLANFLARRGATRPAAEGARAVPSYPFPETAAVVLARMAERAEWLALPDGDEPALAGLDPDAARAVVEAALAAGTGGVAALAAGTGGGGAWLDPDAAAALLAAYGVPLAPAERVASAGAAAEVATRLGFPVALKAAAAEARAAEVGAVRLNLSTPEEVAGAYAGVVALGPGGGAVGGAVVQAMVEGGLHTTVAVVADPSFGPVVTFGIGTAAGLVGDRSARILPLTERDAAALVRTAQGSELLFGHRGAPPADAAALEDLVLRVGRLADDVPELAEAALPVVASPSGAVAVDARVRVAPWHPRPELAMRRLR